MKYQRPSEFLVPEMRALLADLVKQGVELPAPLRTGLAQLDALAVLPLDDLPVVGSLLDLSVSDLLAARERRAHVIGLSTALEGVSRELSIGVVQELRAALLSSLDDVLDQLRPSFDAAGAGIKRAATAGITPGTHAEDVLQLHGQAAAAAWRGLPALVTELESVSRIRIRLASLLEVPAPDPFAEDNQAYATCFTDSGAAWVNSLAPYESSRDRWLRLSLAGDVRLLTVAETVAAAERIKTIPPALAAFTAARAQQDAADSSDLAAELAAFGGAA